MKLSIDRGEFLRALTHAAAIVERRNTIPVLSNVLLEATGEALKLTSTDLDLQIALTLKANVESEGATTVSAQLLHGIVRELADGSQIELALVEKQLQVRSGRSSYKLQTLPIDQFPVIKPANATSTFVLGSQPILDSLKRIEFAQSTELATRDYLCGVQVETAGGEIVFAATDGNCLGFAKLAAPEGADVASAILPTKLVTTLGKLLDGVGGDVRLFFNERMAVFEMENAVLTSKLLDGSYPNWRRVLPPDGQGKPLLIHAEALESAVRRAIIVASEKTRAVKIDLSADKLTASCVSIENGQGVEEAPCAWDGGEFQIGFNSRFLLNIVRASGADELRFDLIDAAAPTLISNPADDSAKWVVMPMRV